MVHFRFFLKLLSFFISMEYFTSCVSKSFSLRWEITLRRNCYTASRKFPFYFPVFYSQAHSISPAYLLYFKRFDIWKAKVRNLQRLPTFYRGKRELSLEQERAEPLSRTGMVEENVRENTITNNLATKRISGSVVGLRNIKECHLAHKVQLPSTPPMSQRTIKSKGDVPEILSPFQVSAFRGCEFAQPTPSPRVKLKRAFQLDLSWFLP